MIRHRLILGMRNKLASLAADCDSCAAIDPYDDEDDDDEDEEED